MWFYVCIYIPCTFLLKQLKAWLVKEPRTLPGCGPCPARMPQNGYPISPVFGGEYNPPNLCGWQNTSALSQKEPKNLALEIPLFLTCLSQLKFGPKIVQKNPKTLIATQKLPPNSQKKCLAPWSSPSCPFPPALLALHRRTCPKPAARPGQTAWSFAKGFFIKMGNSRIFHQPPNGEFTRIFREFKVHRNRNITKQILGFTRQNWHVASKRIWALDVTPVGHPHPTWSMGTSARRPGLVTDFMMGEN